MCLRQLLIDLKCIFSLFLDERKLNLASVSVQRHLPRPFEINSSILRPTNVDPPLTDLQKAEELIKKEMLIMQNFDCANFPPDVKVTRMPDPKKAKTSTTKQSAQNYLSSHPFVEYTEEELAQVLEIFQLSFCRSFMLYQDEE